MILVNSSAQINFFTRVDSLEMIHFRCRPRWCLRELTPEKMWTKQYWKWKQPIDGWTLIQSRTLLTNYLLHRVKLSTNVLSLSLTLSLCLMPPANPFPSRCRSQSAELFYIRCFILYRIINVCVLLYNFATCRTYCIVQWRICWYAATLSQYGCEQSERAQAFSNWTLETPFQFDWIGFSKLIAIAVGCIEFPCRYHPLAHGMLNNCFYTHTHAHTGIGFPWQNLQVPTWLYRLSHSLTHTHTRWIVDKVCFLRYYSRLNCICTRQRID